MTQLVSVDEPAASSLSSCLCAFPGGFSVLTETGRLRPYLVSEARKASHAGSAVAEVVAATPVHLSTALLQQGSFPTDRDIPVSHTWSRDGSVLVVLRRSSFTAYWRDSTCSDSCGTSPRLGSRRGNDEHITDTELGSSTGTPRNVAPSLDLAEVHTGTNGFEGKVVACCLLGVATAASAAGSGRNGRTYLIAVGGSFGIECHAFQPPVACRSNAGSSSGRFQQQQPATRGTVEKQDLERGQASPTETERPTSGAAGAAAAAVTAICRSLVSLFRGYPVVALALSRDSGLLVAAAMTGHVKVWDVSLIAKTNPPSPPTLPTNKVSAGRGPGCKKGSTDALSATQPSRRRDTSDVAALWGVTVRG